jgi:hypothetical protein
MDLLKEAFIEGYKQRAESSDLIFDNASRMYAISLFDKWKSEQLLLHNVSQQRELLVAYEKQHYTTSEWALASKQCEKEIDDFLAINCG